MNSETVTYLAELARLDIPEGEKEGLVKDLESMIGFVDRIQKVEIGDTAQSSNKAVNVFREDTVAPIERVYDLVDAAPEHQDHFVKVPKVLE